MEAMNHFKDGGQKHRKNKYFQTLEGGVSQDSLNCLLFSRRSLKTKNKTADPMVHPKTSDIRCAVPFKNGYFLIFPLKNNCVFALLF